jgi:hypothetical protein
MGGTSSHDAESERPTIEEQLRSISRRVVLNHTMLEALTRAVIDIQRDVALLIHRADRRNPRGSTREKRL